MSRPKEWRQRARTKRPQAVKIQPRVYCDPRMPDCWEPPARESDHIAAELSRGIK